MSPATASDSLVWTAKASDAAVSRATPADALATSPIVKAVTLSKNPVGYWRLADAGNVAVDSSGNGHDGAISGYADLIKSKAGLQAYWRLEETSGSTVADSQGANTGTLSASGVGLGVTGPLLDPDRGASFDGGATTLIQVASSGGINPNRGQDFSVEFWFKFTGSGLADRSFLEKWSGADGYPYVFRGLAAAGNDLRFNTYDGTNNPGVSQSSSPVTLNDGTWHHIVGTRTGTTLSLYVDGGLRGTATDTTTGTDSNNDPLTIGNRGGGGKGMPGSLDEIAIYNVALTANEVAAHYTVGVITRAVRRGVVGVLPGDPASASMLFDGANGSISVPGSASLDMIGASYSVAIWLNRTGPGFSGYTPWVGRGGAGPQHSYFLAATDRHLWRWDSFDSGYVITEGQWYHVVYRFVAVSDTSGTESFHINGALQASRTGAVPASSVAGTGWAIGEAAGGGHWFQGGLADLAIFNYALSPADISDLYLAGKNALGAKTVISEAKI